MKPKEAINVLRWSLNQLEGKHYIKDGFGTIDASAKVDAFAMAIEALEKQIPKKPNIIHVKYQRRYNDKYLCPVCGKSVDTDCGDPFMDYGLDWCNHCGQAIDWGEGD